jgi:hypothetical protein
MNKASFEQVLGLLKKLLLNVKIHSVHVIRTVWLTVTQLQSLLSESSLTGLLVIRTTGSPDNKFCILIPR